VVKVADGPMQSLGYHRLLHSAGATGVAWGDSETGIKNAQLKQ